MRLLGAIVYRCSMTRRDMHRLAAETGASLPTIRKWLEDPSSVTRPNAYALAAGAKRLRIVVERAPELATGTEG